MTKHKYKHRRLSRGKGRRKVHRPGKPNAVMQSYSREEIRNDNLSLIGSPGSRLAALLKELDIESVDVYPPEDQSEIQRWPIQLRPVENGYLHISVCYRFGSQFKSQKVLAYDSPGKLAEIRKRIARGCKSSRRLG